MSKITFFSVKKTHLRLNYNNHANNLILGNFFILKNLFIVKKSEKNKGFSLNLGQFKKMQKSAKCLISFFCYVHMSPLLGKKIGSGKVRHLEKFTVIYRDVLQKVA